MQELTFGRGYSPGAIGRITELHGTYYSARWGFGRVFEAKVARELSEFLLRYDEARDGIWLAKFQGRVEGSIVIDAIHCETQGAHLRWFILSDAARGMGLGTRLINIAMDFCGERGYSKIYLWTFQGLDAARHLYQQAGFQLIKAQPGSQWGTPVTEQYYERRTPLSG